VACTGWAAAGTIHRIECGGEDGELHIGAFNPNIIANNDEMPVSSPVLRQKSVGSNIRGRQNTIE